MCDPATDERACQTAQTAQAAQAARRSGRTAMRPLMAAALAASGLFAGCASAELSATARSGTSGAAGSTGASAEAGAASSQTSPQAGAARLSFASVIYERVIRVSCASCHNDGPSFGGLALFPGADTAYSNLVGVPAGREETYQCRNSGLMRVSPGDPEHSLLYLKLTMPSCGKKMPPAALGGKVTQEQVDLVRQWIAQGAAP